VFIRRKGDGAWGMPAGAMELNESIFDCLRREVEEETGLKIMDATLIAIYSNPEKQSFTDRFGNEHQIIEYLFHVEQWTGELKKETDESTNAEFFPIDALPEASSGIFAKHHRQVFEDFRSFNGQVILK
jgi:ADP-ribose pyrophosphatase YjhB (NUDIX family)